MSDKEFMYTMSNGVHVCLRKEWVEFSKMLLEEQTQEEITLRDKQLVCHKLIHGLFLSNDQASCSIYLAVKERDARRLESPGVS